MDAIKTYLKMILNNRKRLLCLALCAVVLISCVAAAFAVYFSQYANKVVVCLDAGHGGEDMGAIGINGRLEKDDNLRLTLAVKDILEEKGVKVVLTRDDDSKISLKDRCKKANRKNALLFVAIHRNSAESASASGFEIWVRDDRPRRDTALAERILQNLEAAGISNNRGVKSGIVGNAQGNYYVNANTDMPSCLAEIGFISSEEDNRLFDENFDEYARAIAAAAVDELEAEYGIVIDATTTAAGE